MSAGFNEREFEFCFNAEFVRKNSAALIGTPIIPSQRMENVLGYDVEFRIQNGRFSRSLFLQHKVSSYAQHRRGRNADIWNCYFGPYFRFPIERLDRTRQHNLLVELAERGEDVFYCAPVFVGLDNLQNCFVQDNVIDNSRFFDPKDMGKVTDFEKHHVSYDPTGSFGFFHTEPKKLEKTVSWKTLKEETTERHVDLRYAEQLIEVLYSAVITVFDAAVTVPDKVKEGGTILTISYVLRRYFDVEWLILP